MHDQVVMQVRAWAEAQRLGALWSPLVHTVTTWIASAAPAHATVEQRLLACLDLGTCFFLLDDATDDARARHDDLEHVASGGSPVAHRPLQAAFAALFARLSSWGSLAHYLALRVEFARALRVRERIRSGAAIDLEGYLALREITIYFGPWLSTWQLLDGCELSPRERAAVAPAFAPANRWQVLENERLSVARDQVAGTPNLIAMLAAQRGDSLATASAEVRTWADADLDAYTAAVLALRKGPLTTPVASYLTLLEAGVDGAIHHYKGADAARYR